jgi:hypothetical protein
MYSIQLEVEYTTVIYKLGLDLDFKENNFGAPTYYLCNFE